MVLMKMTDAEASTFVAAVRKARAINILLPMIRRLREMQRRKPNTRMCTVSPCGDIAVDGFEFAQEKWSTVIPETFAVCRNLLEQLFEGEDWLSFLDTNNPLTVCQSPTGRCLFSLVKNGMQKESGELGLTCKVDSDIVLDRLCSHIEVAFHGFGGGSARANELTKLQPLHAIWHRGTIYFSTESIKKFTFKSPTGKSRNCWK